MTVIQTEMVVFFNSCARRGTPSYDSFAKREEKLLSKYMHWLQWLFISNYSHLVKYTFCKTSLRPICLVRNLLNGLREAVSLNPQSAIKQ